MEIDKSEVFRVLVKFQEQYRISDKLVLQMTENGMTYDVMKILVEPPSNCTSCMKHTKYGRVSMQDVPLGIKFDYLCIKCLKKSLDGPTKCTIERSIGGQMVFRCPHCLLEKPLKDVGYFKDHNCVNITMTRDFASSLAGDKK